MADYFCIDRLSNDCNQHYSAMVRAGYVSHHKNYSLENIYRNNSGIVLLYIDISDKPLAESIRATFHMFRGALTCERLASTARSKRGRQGSHIFGKVVQGFGLESFEDTKLENGW